MMVAAVETYNWVEESCVITQIEGDTTASITSSREVMKNIGGSGGPSMELL